MEKELWKAKNMDNSSQISDGCEITSCDAEENGDVSPTSENPQMKSSDELEKPSLEINEAHQQLEGRNECREQQAEILNIQMKSSDELEKSSPEISEAHQQLERCNECREQQAEILNIQMKSSDELEKPSLEIKEAHQQLEGCNECREQQAQILKVLIRKDRVIGSMTTKFNELEKQLQTAVHGKFEALARLEAMEGKELNLSFKEKRMSLEVECLNKNIENLMDDLQKNATELITVRHELASASSQYDIDIKQKSEELKIANLKIHELSEANEMFKTQNSEYAYKLKEQLSESKKVFKDYDNELEAKDALIELYNREKHCNQEYIDDLKALSADLRLLLDDTANDCDMLQTELNETEINHKNDSDAMIEMIAKLKRELDEANCLLKAYEKVDGDNPEDGELAALKKGITFTELYSEYCNVFDKLQETEEECKILKEEMKNLLDEVKKKAIDFDQQQNALKKFKKASEDLLAERNNFVAESVVCRKEIQDSVLRCKILLDENNKLKFFGSENMNNFLPNGRAIVESVPLALRESSTDVELKAQNEQLLAMVQSLLVKVHCMENFKFTDEYQNVCDKSVEVTEDLAIEDKKQVNEVPEIKSQQGNLVKIEEHTEHSTKLQMELSKPTAEINAKLPDANVSNVQSSTMEILPKLLETESGEKIDTAGNQNLSEMECWVNSPPSTSACPNTEMSAIMTTADDVGSDNNDQSTFLRSLQLTKSLGDSPQSTSTPMPNIPKPSIEQQNAGEEMDPLPAASIGCSKRLRSSQPKKRIFVDLSEDSDEDRIIEVCDDDGPVDLPNIELQFLSEVRTRKQAKFIHDAFHGQAQISGDNGKTSTQGEKKVSDVKQSGRRGSYIRSQSSKRGRSSRRGSTSRQQSSTPDRFSATRSQSVDQQSSLVSHVLSDIDHAGENEKTNAKQDGDDFVVNRRSYRLSNRYRQSGIGGSLNK